MDDVRALSPLAKEKASCFVLTIVTTMKIVTTRTKKDASVETNMNLRHWYVYCPNG